MKCEFAEESWPIDGRYRLEVVLGITVVTSQTFESVTQYETQYDDRTSAVHSSATGDSYRKVSSSWPRRREYDSGGERTKERWNERHLV